MPVVARGRAPKTTAEHKSPCLPACLSPKFLATAACAGFALLASSSTATSVEPEYAPQRRAALPPSRFAAANLARGFQRALLALRCASDQMMLALGRFSSARARTT